MGEGAFEPKDEEEEEGPKEEVPVGELLNTIAIGPSVVELRTSPLAATKVATLDADGIGRDGTVMVVDLEAKSIAAREVVIGGTSCCFSPDGSQVLVGKENGSGLVFGIADGIMTQAGVLTPPEPEAPEPAPVEEGEEGEEPAPVEEPATVAPISAAQVCRWAEGTLALACGATVYLYNTDYSSKGSATLSADITSMDFKADGSVLMVGTADLDLAFISAEDGSTYQIGRGATANGRPPRFPWPTVSRACWRRCPIRGWMIRCAMRLPRHSTCVPSATGSGSIDFYLTRARRSLVPSPYQDTAPASPGAAFLRGGWLCECWINRWLLNHVESGV